MRGCRPYLDVDTLRMWQQHATTNVVATLRNSTKQLVVCTLLYVFMFFKLLSAICIHYSRHRHRPLMYWITDPIDLVRDNFITSTVFGQYQPSISSEQSIMISHPCGMQLGLLLHEAFVLPLVCYSRHRFWTSTWLAYSHLS